MQHQVHLRADLARCRTDACQRKGTCARALAPIVQHSPVQDFMVSCNGICTYFIDASQHQQPLNSAAPRKFKTLGGEE